LASIAASDIDAAAQSVEPVSADSNSRCGVPMTYPRPIAGWGRILAGLASAAFAATLATGCNAAAQRTFAGPIIGGIAANNGYYAYGPYYSPAPFRGFSPLYGPAYPYPAGCYLQRQRIWTEYGWRWRVAPICY
jgi:hypothetical protein